MTTASPLFGAAVTVTVTLASLASSATFTVGRQSTLLDQKDTDDAIDVMLGGKVTTGTSPTSNAQIRIHAIGTYDDVTFTAGAGATDAGLTPDDPSLLPLAWIIPVSSTSNKSYRWGPVSLLRVFRSLVLPAQWGVWITHNCGAALHATAGNHEVKYMPVKFESA